MAGPAREKTSSAWLSASYLWGMGQLFLELLPAARESGSQLAASVIFATRWSYVPALIILLIPVALLLWRRRADWRLWWQEPGN